MATVTIKPGEELTLAIEGVGAIYTFSTVFVNNYTEVDLEVHDDINSVIVDANTFHLE